MATLTTAAVTLRPGTQLTLAAAAGGGDKFTPGQDTFFVCTNGGGSPITVTFDDPRSVQPSGSNTFDPDPGGSVTNGTTKVFGPFPTARFAGLADGLCAVTYSGVTTVTVGVFTT